MFRTRFIFSLLFALASVSTAFGGEVPFTLEGGQVIVKAKIKKDVAVEAAVMTGKPYSYLNPDLITRLKMQMSYTADGPVTGRNDKIVLFNDVPGVSVGDEKPVSLHMRNDIVGGPTPSLAALSKKIGREIGVVLGADFFEGRIVQFDFQAKVIRFLDAPPVDYKKPPAEASVHRMAAAYDTFYGGHVSLPVAADAMFDGVKVNTLFDTGAPVAFVVSPALAKRLSVAPPDKGASAQMTLKTLKVGAADFAGVPGFALGKGANSFLDDVDYDAVIGLGAIQNLRVTFDWSKDMLVIER